MTLLDQRGPPLGRRRHGLLGGVGLGDAPPNSKKSSAFFFGGAISARETAPLFYATAFFAFYGGGVVAEWASKGICALVRLSRRAVSNVGRPSWCFSWPPISRSTWR